MGSGRWSTDVYTEKEKARSATGKSAFDYSDTAKKTGDMKVHPTLDPHGVKFRESRDSDEHPDSNSIVVMFDVTGSMGKIPVGLQKNLPQLLGLLLYKNYIADPQILFGAVGDATCDRVPLQVGQFESDNRMDEHLQNIILEGGGGGQGTESYEMAMYFISRHTAMDCWEKRRKKGYLFMIGDEMAYGNVKAKEVEKNIADGLDKDIPLADIVAEVHEKFHFFYIIPVGASYGRDNKVYDFWKNVLGQQHVLQLENPEAIAELIAMVIGTCEGTIGLDDGLADLKASGAKDTTIETVKKAISAIPMTNAVIKGSGTSLIPKDEPDSTPKTRRL